MTTARPLFHAGSTRALAVALLALSGAVAAQTVQQHVHGHGHGLMPFDLGKTVHVFRMTEDGGTQRVVLRGDAADPAQLQMIQHHLSMEAAEFQKGNFGDPVRLHGQDMPGLKDLQAGAARMQVAYRALPNGAEIAFRSDDIEVITAIHRVRRAVVGAWGRRAR